MSVSAIKIAIASELGDLLSISPAFQNSYKMHTSYVLTYYPVFTSEHKALSGKTSLLFAVEKSYNLVGSMDEILKELDAEKAQITVSTEIRRFNKPVTIVQGLQDNKDVISLTKYLKNKIGTGGTFKEGKIMLQGNHKGEVVNLLMAFGFDEKIIAIR
jgi:translation initiation factor 1